MTVLALLLTFAALGLPGETGGVTVPASEPSASRATRTTLPSGFTLVVLPRGPVPWTRFRVEVPIGSAQDPPGKSGLARVVGLLFEASLRSGDPLRPLERLGAEVTVRTTLATTVLEGGVAEAEVDELLDQVMRRLASVDVREDSVHAAIARAIGERQALDANERSLARAELRRQVFGAHPAGIDPLGAVEELASITANDVRALVSRQLRAGGLALALTHTSSAAALTHRAEAWTEALPAGKSASSDPRRARRPGKPEAELGDATNPGRADPRSASRRGPVEPHLTVPSGGRSSHLASLVAPRSSGHRVVVIDEPGIGDAVILAGKSAPGQEDARYAAVLAATTALAGCFSSHLARALAEELPPEGTAASALIPGPGSLFTLELLAPPERTAAVLRQLLTALAKVHRDGLDAAELELGRRHAIGRALLEQASPATALSAALASGGPLSAALAAADAADIQAAARALAAPDDLVLVLITSATPTLQRELASIPGVKDVSITSYEGR